LKEKKRHGCTRDFRQSRSPAPTPAPLESATTPDDAPTPQRMDGGFGGARARGAAWLATTSKPDPTATLRPT